MLLQKLRLGVSTQIRRSVNPVGRIRSIHRNQRWDPGFASGILLVCSLFATSFVSLFAAEKTDAQPEALVRSCPDFELTGTGSSAHWRRAEWVPLTVRPDGKHPYTARFKMLYSKTGVYVLFDGTDQTLTATMTADFLDLWNEDVFECFFWTDERHPVYFEYEISPLGYELPILIPNLEGEFLGWRPWHYEGTRRTRKKVMIVGGPQQPQAQIEGWQAEVFVPYELLKPLRNVPPKSGTRWRANFYRVDYDDGAVTGWDWARVGPSFHDFRNFGTLVFE